MKLTQKAVIKLTFKKEKFRSKALKVVVSAHKSCTGITSVTWKESDTVELVGDNVDIVKLVRLMGKKLGGATIISLDPVVAEKAAKDTGNPLPPCVCYPPAGYPHGDAVILYDSYCRDSAPTCSIL